MSESTSSSTTNTPFLELTIEDAIDRLGTGPFQRRVLIATGFCNAADAMEIILLSFLSIVVQEEFGVSAAGGSLTTSIVFVGATVGTLTMGPMGDRFGRFPTCILGSVVISGAGLLSALAPNYWTMVVLRFCVGFGLGGAVISYDLLAEYIPAVDRGNYMMYHGCFWTIGTVAVPLLGYLGLDQGNSWRLFVAYCSFPCVISTILAMVWVPESPRWLIARGRNDKALEILRNAAIINGKDPLQTFPHNIQFVDDPNEEHGMHSIGCLFQREWRRLTLTLWAGWLGMAFVYWGTIQLVTLVFMGTETSDASGEATYTFDYFSIALSSAAEIFGSFFNIILLSRVGRISLTSFLYLTSGISIVGLCMLAAHRTSSEDHRSGMIVLSFFARMLSNAAGMLCWLITAELIPTQVRNTGHCFAYAVARIGGVLSPWVISSDNSFQLIGIVMGAASLYAGALVCLLPETKGRALGTAASFMAGEKPSPMASEIL